MGLLIGLLVLILLGICASMDFSSVKRLVGEIIAIGFFWWLGSLFASIPEVLSLHFSFTTIVAGFFYAIAAFIVLMKVVCIFK